MPAVTRVGDQDIKHCTNMTRAEGSSNVFCNGIPVSRQGDKNTPHFAPGHSITHVICRSHAAPIAKGSSTVKVNGRGCGRVGDAIAGCTSVAQGSSNVFAGG
tara:strand:- start:700 stop:1005 length:306 start_codon:yes stop_codon:yes gene_type:complete